MQTRPRNTSTTVCLALLYQLSLFAADDNVVGRVTDPQRRSVAGAHVRISRDFDGFSAEKITDDRGSFVFNQLNKGDYRLTVEAPGFKAVTRDITTSSAIQPPVIEIQFTEIAPQTQSITVTADVGDSDAFSPDPATRVMVRQETLDANPGRPGMPISIPGMSVESPAGGIKPPQYFSGFRVVLSSFTGS